MISIYFRSISHALQNELLNLWSSVYYPGTVCNKTVCHKTSVYLSCTQVPESSEISKSFSSNFQSLPGIGNSRSCLFYYLIQKLM